jgi:hypothetical protein
MKIRINAKSDIRLSDKEAAHLGSSPRKQFEIVPFVLEASQVETMISARHPNEISK